MAGISSNLRLDALRNPVFRVEDVSVRDPAAVWHEGVCYIYYTRHIGGWHTQAAWDIGVVTTSDFITFSDETIITPPVTENILEGITRRTAMELLSKEIGIPVIERQIDRTEVYLCDEFFMTGTAAQVTAVTRVDHRPIGTGKMGPITTQLRQIFSDVVYGRYPNYRHWNLPVYAEVPETVV